MLFAIPSAGPLPAWGTEAWDAEVATLLLTIEAVIDDEESQLKAAIDPKLIEDVGEMVFHGVLTQGQARGDLAVGTALKDDLDDLDLSSRQSVFVPPFGFAIAAFTQFLNQVGHAGIAEPVFSACDLVQALNQGVSGLTFEDQAAGPQTQKGNHLLSAEG